MRHTSNNRFATVPRTVPQFAVGARLFAKKITFCWLLTAGCGASIAGELSVGIKDLNGHGVSDAVVTLAPLGETPPPPSAPANAVMDQQHLSFVPRVLVVPVGSRVDFPNSDSVSHQVYSFSPPKKFQLPLYKGQLHPPVVFDQAGLVVLGCNIHDQMVAYIYVTAAPHFGKTDASGELHVTDLKSGDYRLTVWSPMIADAPSTMERTVHVDGASGAIVQLQQALRPRPEPRPHRGDWEY